MTGPFVFVLVGVPYFLRRKLYPQKLLVLSKRRLNWGGLDLPIGQARMERTWGQDTGPPQVGFRHPRHKVTCLN